MSNTQNNTDQNVPSQKGVTSANDKQSHFVQARRIIEKWPDWKKNIRCMPTSMNGNQYSESHDKT